MSLLSIQALDAFHGLLPAVRGLSLDVQAGEKIALVGANGAGKTTLLRSIAGVHRPGQGRLLFDGADITRLDAHQRVAAGIAMVPEGRRLFATMTVEENLLVAKASGRQGPWSLDAVMDAFPQLKPKRHARAAELSGGQQQAVAIGRALMTNPRLLLLDELSLGLSPIAVQGVYQSLHGVMTGAATLGVEATTMILVEQDLQRALSVADRVVCMLEGHIVAQGRASDMTREQVMAHYFGNRGNTP